MDHERFMHRCLELAEKGRGQVKQNPMVGAVLVHGDEIIAESYHERYGEGHAERKILKSVQKISSDYVLYVSLEPCCHHGKTPPCTDIIIEKGITHVVYGMQDPNPEVAGKGIEALRDAGIVVTGPVLEEECRALNRGFISVMTKGRPWITVKKAQTEDGRIANEDGSFLKITSEEQDLWSHEHLRAKHDAILVGVGTVLSDDPQLNTRFIQNMNKKCDQKIHQPLPVVLDPNLRIPVSARVIRPKSIIITSSLASLEKMKVLEDKGAAIITIPIADGQFDLDALFKVLIEKGVTSILIEGGPKTWESFIGYADDDVILVGEAPLVQSGVL